MNKPLLCFFDTPIGKLGIVESKGYIIEIVLPNDVIQLVDFSISESVEILKAKKQLNEYFLGKRKYFDFKFKQEGTAFRQSVWEALLKIPYGETRSYKDIAVSIENPLACRAVGQANNKNKLPIVIPCHRVIGTDNSFVGYAGGLGIKKYLIELEKHNI